MSQNAEKTPLLEYLRNDIHPPSEKRRKSPSKPPQVGTVTPSKKRINETIVQRRAAAMVRRYFLLSTVRTLLPQERTASCMRIITGDAAWVFVERDKENKRARFKNVGRCSAVWCCPVCANIISERRRDELTRLTIAARQQGLKIYMATYTLRHTVNEPLVVSMTAIKSAHVRLKQGKQGMAYRDRFGIVGSVRGFEITHGDNGWHPHFHELILCKPSTDTEKQAVEMEAYLRQRWINLLSVYGADARFDIGVKVTSEAAEIATYIAKHGKEPEDYTWGFERELAKANSKIGRENGRTPFQLVEDYVAQGDKQAAALFIEFAATMKGQRQLAWSKGLKEMLGVDVREDEQANVEPGHFDIVAAIHKEDWRLIVRRELQAEVVNIAATGDMDRLKRLLIQIRGESGELHHTANPADLKGWFAQSDVDIFEGREDVAPF